MNLFEAKKLLELPDNWNGDQDILKKNYRRLAMKYHPDKSNDSGETFVKINEANVFMERINLEPINPFIIDINIGDLLKKMMNQAPQPLNTEISIKEYILGTVKKIKIVCERCSGCGFEPDVSFCIRCKGNDSFLEIEIPKFMDLTKNIIFHKYSIAVKINSKRYSVLQNKIYYKFDISLKESLIGFDKEFKDPLGNTHKLSISQVPIKQNDGYLISTMEFNIILLFNIIYPSKNFSKDTIDQFRSIKFF